MQRKSNTAKPRNHEVEGKGHLSGSVGVRKGTAKLSTVTQPADVALTDSEPQAAHRAQAQAQSQDGLRHSSSSFLLALRFCSDGIRQEAKRRTFYIFPTRLAHERAY